MSQKTKRKSEKTDRTSTAWRKLGRKIAGRLADSPLPEIAFISSLILIRWWNNSDFSYPSEIWVPLLLFAALGSVTYVVYRLILGRGLAPHVAALGLSYGFYVFTFVRDSQPAQAALDLLPDRWETDFTASLYLTLWMGLICGLIGWLAGQALGRYKTLQNLQPYKVLLFAILFVFAFQLYKTADRLWDIRRQLAYQYPVPQLVATDDKIAQRPDIYYVIFDRYASADVLKNNFDYDNSTLMSFLDERGFVTRNPAYSNYPFTMSSIASTMAMSYFPEFEQKFGEDGDWQTAFPYRSVLNNPPIAQLLKKHSYQYNQVSSWWDFTRIGIKADANPTQSFRLRAVGGEWYLSDLQRDIINKSILSPWLKKGISAGQTAIFKYDLNRNPGQNFEAQISALKSIASRPDKSVPQFSFAHFLAPHPPYVFLADGSTPSYDAEANDNGVDETTKYKNELAFVNSQLKSLVNDIQKGSPGAIIVLQADEGPYPKQFRGPMSSAHYYDPIDLPLPAMRQKLGILASYYLPGLDKEKVKQMNSSVNIFRFILNNYLGYSLPTLPDCYFSTGNKFTIYSYQRMSDNLTDRPADSGCSQYDSQDD